MTGSKAIVRPARDSDVPRVKEILADTFETVWQPQITATSAERYITTDTGGRYVDDHWPEFWVAELDGDVHGMIHWDGDFIEALHVASARQGRGLGRMLLARAEAEIADAGFRQVRLETDTFNEASQAFYRSLGYIETDRYPDEEWDSGLTTVLFEKRLD